MDRVEKFFLETVFGGAPALGTVGGTLKVRRAQDVAENAPTTRRSFTIDTICTAHRWALASVVAASVAGGGDVSLEDESARFRAYGRAAIRVDNFTTDRIKYIEECAAGIFGDSFVVGGGAVVAASVVIFPRALLSLGARAVLAAALGAGFVVLDSVYLPYSKANSDNAPPRIITHVRDVRGEWCALPSHDNAPDRCAKNVTDARRAMDSDACDVDPFLLLPSPQQVAEATCRGVGMARLLVESPLAATLDTNTRYRCFGRVNEWMRDTLIVRGSRNELVWKLPGGTNTVRWIFCNGRDLTKQSRDVIVMRGAHFGGIDHSQFVRPLAGKEIDPDQAFEVPPVGMSAPDESTSRFFASQPERNYFDGYYVACNAPMGLLKEPVLVPGIAEPPMFMHECGSPYRTVVFVYEFGEDTASAYMRDARSAFEATSLLLQRTFFRVEDVRVLPNEQVVDLMTEIIVDEFALWRVSLVTRMVVDDKHWALLVEAARSVTRSLRRKGVENQPRVRVADRFPYIRGITSSYKLGFSRFRPRLVVKGGDYASALASALYDRTSDHQWTQALMQRLYRQAYGDEVLVPAEHLRVSSRHWFECTTIRVYRRRLESPYVVVYLTDVYGVVQYVERTRLLDGELVAGVELRVKLPPRPVVAQVIGLTGIVAMNRGGHVGYIDEKRCFYDTDTELREACDGIDGVVVHDIVRGERFPPIDIHDLLVLNPNKPPPHDAAELHVTWLQGPCGVGKSTALKNVLLQTLGTDDSSMFVYISARRAVVQQECEKARADPTARRYVISHYKNRVENTGTRALYTTLHSLYRFVGAGMFFDPTNKRERKVVVVFDEFSTALLNDYQSSKIVNGALTERALGQLFACIASDIYLLDAHDSPVLVANLIKRVTHTSARAYFCFTPRPIHVHTYRATFNLVKQQRRRARIMCGPASRDELLWTIAYDYLDEGKRVAMFFSSRRELEFCRSALVELIPAIEGKSMTFSSTERPDNVAALAEEMLRLDTRLFLYTTAASSGVDISFLGELGSQEEMFEAVCMVGVTAPYLNVQSVLQASARVRCTSQMLVSMPSFPADAFELASSREWTSVMRETLPRLVSQMQDDAECMQTLRLLEENSMDASVRAVLYQLFMPDGSATGVRRDDSVYAETLAFGYMQERSKPFLTSLVVALFAELGYDVTLVYSGENDSEDAAVSREEIMNMREYVDRNELRLYVESALAEQMPLDVKRKSINTRRALGMSWSDGANDNLNVIETLLVNNENELRRTLPVLYAYHYLAVNQPEGVGAWRAAINACTAEVASATFLARAMEQRTEMSQGTLSSASELAVRSRSQETSSVYAAVCLYVAARLANMTTRGFFMPMNPQIRASDDGDELVPDLGSLMRGELELKRISSQEAVLDRIFGRDGLWELPKMHMQGKKTSRHVQRMLRHLCGKCFNSKRGRISAAKDDDLALIFGFYFDYAAQRSIGAASRGQTPFISDERVLEAAEHYDGYEVARAEYAVARAKPTMEERMKVILLGDTPRIVKLKKAYSASIEDAAASARSPSQLPAATSAARAFLDDEAAVAESGEEAE